MEYLLVGGAVIIIVVCVTLYHYLRMLKEGSREVLLPLIKAKLDPKEWQLLKEIVGGGSVKATQETMEILVSKLNARERQLITELIEENEAKEPENEYEKFLEFARNEDKEFYEEFIRLDKERQLTFVNSLVDYQTAISDFNESLKNQGRS